MTDKTGNVILKLIEEVDPSDTAKLDEIDWKVTGFLKFSHEWHHEWTRSRDALKSIRPEGWCCVVKGSFCQCDLNVAAFNYKQFKSPALPTEELAELHAIIQAIEYERSHNKTGETHG